MTPIHESINQVRALKDRDYSKEEIVTVLQSLLPKEKEFVDTVWTNGMYAGYNSVKDHEPWIPAKQQFINQLYPKQ